jgi:hypothetical protein
MKILIEYNKEKDAYECRDIFNLELVGHLIIVDNIKYYMKL